MRNHDCKSHTRAALPPARRAALAAIIIAWALLPPHLMAQLGTTTVQGTIYRADGTPAAGTLLVSWPAFTTAQNQAVAAGSLNTTLSADGFVSMNLTPNAGGTPAGSYYTAVYHLSDGTVNTEYWIVPASGTAAIASIRAQLEPATMAIQAASQTYVNNAVSALAGNSLPLTGGVMTGPLTLSADPTAASQAATKHYADQLAASNLPLSGGTLTGPLSGTTASFSGTVAGAVSVGDATTGVTNLSTALSSCGAACVLDMANNGQSCTRTDGVACWSTPNNAMVRNSLLTATGATVPSILTNADHSGNQEYWFASGLGITSSRSTVSTAALDLQSVFVNSYLRDSVIWNNANTWAAKLHNNGTTHQGFGPFLSENNWYTGTSEAGSKGVWISDESGGGNISDFTSLADTFENFDPANWAVQTTSTNGQLNNLYFLQPHLESTSNGFDIGGARNITLESPAFGGGGGTTAVQIENGVQNVCVRNMQSSWTNAIVDNINSRTVTAGAGGPALVAAYCVGPSYSATWNTRGFVYAGNPGGELEIMHPQSGAVVEDLRLSGTGGSAQPLQQVFYNVGDANPSMVLRNDGSIQYGQGGSSAADFAVGERHGSTGYWGVFNSSGTYNSIFSNVPGASGSQINIPGYLRVGDVTTTAPPATAYVDGTFEATGAVTLPALTTAGLVTTTSGGALGSEASVPAAQGGTGTTNLTGIRYANGGSADTAATAAQLSAALGVAGVAGSGALGTNSTLLLTGQYAAVGYQTLATTGSSATQLWEITAFAYQDSAVTCTGSYGSFSVKLKWSDARGSGLSYSSSTVTFVASPVNTTQVGLGPFLLNISPNTAIQVEGQYTAGTGCSGNGSTYTMTAFARQLK